jgi:hypothetical protein
MGYDLTKWFENANAHILAASIRPEDLQGNIDVDRVSEAEVTTPSRLHGVVSFDERMERNIRAAAIGELSAFKFSHKLPSADALREKIAELQNPQPGWEAASRLAREALEDLLGKLTQG